MNEHKTCMICGKPFIAKRCDQVACSPECQKVRNERRRPTCHAECGEYIEFVKCKDKYQEYLRERRRASSDYPEWRKRRGKR